MTDADEDLHELNLRMLGQINQAIDDLLEIRDELMRLKATPRMMATAAIGLFWILIVAIWGGAIWALFQLWW